MTVSELDFGPDFDGFVLENEPMSRHTTYRIGGPARYFAQVDSLGSLSRFIDFCDEQNISWVPLGKGSNLLVSDDGFDGAVITLGPRFSSCSYDADTGIIVAGASARFASVVREAFRRGRAGFEFAVGTPGTIGGALRMNAGSRREGIGARVVSITTFHPQRGLTHYMRDDIVWGYRNCSIPLDEIIVECELETLAGDEGMTQAKMEAALSRRRKTQPLEYPSCGSVFKNPGHASVGQMIEDAGLKGCSCGGAQVSELHANFIINTGDATASDVLALIHHVQDMVRDLYGVTLSTEVKFLGFK